MSQVYNVGCVPTKIWHLIVVLDRMSDRTEVSSQNSYEYFIFVEDYKEVIRDRFIELAAQIGQNGLTTEGVIRNLMYELGFSLAKSRAEGWPSYEEWKEINLGEQK